MRQIQPVKIETIVPYERNNRVHTEEQIGLIAKSITEFGFNQPLVLDEQNVVLVGHGRLLAAQKLGLAEVPAIVIPYLSETQKKAFRILDNKLQNDSTWNFENLTTELQELSAEGVDFDAWGLDDLIKLDPNLGVAGKSLDPGMGNDIEVCVCEKCGFEHARKKD